VLLGDGFWVPVVASHIEGYQRSLTTARKDTRQVGRPEALALALVSLLRDCPPPPCRLRAKRPNDIRGISCARVLEYYALSASAWRDERLGGPPVQTGAKRMEKPSDHE
jgi:hypothetical protein